MAFDIVLVTPVVEGYEKCVNHSVMKAKILVVEDNPDARELVVMVLAHAGYEVLQAANGSTRSIRQAFTIPI